MSSVRSRLLPAVIGVLALAAPATAAASSRAESVVGSGHLLLTDFTVDVHAGARGQHLTGSLVLSGFLSFSASPTCLRIVGNRAVDGYRIDNGSLAGQGFLTSVQDNGPPINGQPVDTVIYSGTLPSPARKCPPPGDSPPSSLVETGSGPLSSGDITITQNVRRHHHRPHGHR